MAEEPDLADMPVVTKVGDDVVMKASDFNDLIARLLLAEGRQERSWLRP